MLSASHPTRTVLIVDDEPFIRVVLTDLFEDAGFAVREASTAAEAMQILRDEASCIDLLLTDVKMPGQHDGFELASWARERCPEAKIVIISGYPGEQGLETKHACDVFVGKPFHPPELVSIAQGLLQPD